MNKIPDHLSYSSINLFTKCPEKWYRTYILGEKEEPDVALSIGRVFHKCMEENFNYKLGTGIDLSKKTIEDIFDSSFNEEVRGLFDPESTLESKNICWKLIEQYHREIAPFITPKAVEQRLEIDLPGKYIKKLIGFVDLETDKGKIIDYKAAAWPWPNDQVTQSLQPTVYGLLLGRKDLDFEYHMIIKSDNIRKEKFGDGIVVKHTVRRQKDFDWLWDMIIKMIGLIESPNLYDLIIPSPGTHCLSCHVRKTCGYRVR